MVKLGQKGHNLRVICLGCAGQDLGLDGIQGVLQVLRFGEALGNAAGVGAVGHIAGDGQIGVIDLGLEVLEAVLPESIHIAGVVVPVPAPGEHLEVGHLVGLRVVHGVTDDAHLASNVVGVGQIVAADAQIDAGLIVLGAGIVQPGYGIVLGLFIRPADVLLCNGGVDVGAGPVDVDILVQTCLVQGPQLGTIAGPAHIVAVGAVNDGAAALILAPIVHLVQESGYLCRGTAVVVVVQDVEAAHAHAVQLLELGLQLFYIVQIFLIGGAVIGVGAAAGEEVTLTDVDGPGVLHVHLLAHFHQMLDLSKLFCRVKFIPVVGVVGIGLGREDIDIALHIPDGADLALAALIGMASIEALDKAAEDGVGIVLDHYGQEFIAVEGGKHHLQGGHTIIDGIHVLTLDGDDAVGIGTGVGTQQIGVVLVDGTGLIGRIEQVGVSFRFTRLTVYQGVFALDAQQNVGFGGIQSGAHDHGAVKAGQDLFQKVYGVLVYIGTLYHVDLFGHGKRAGSVLHGVGHGIDLIGIGIF